MEEFLVTYHVRFPANGSAPGKRDWADLLKFKLFDTTLKAHLTDPELRRHVELSGMPDYGIDMVASDTIGFKDQPDRQRDFGVRHQVVFRDSEPSVKTLSKSDRLKRFLTELLSLPQSDGDWNIVEIGVDHS